MRLTPSSPGMRYWARKRLHAAWSTRCVDAGSSASQCFDTSSERGAATPSTKLQAASTSGRRMIASFRMTARFPLPQGERAILGGSARHSPLFLELRPVGPDRAADLERRGLDDIGHLEQPLSRREATLDLLLVFLGRGGDVGRVERVELHHAARR